jgi:thiol-disulfide isomerase/thioredoxin
MKKHLFVFTILLILLTDISAQTASTNWYSIKGFLPQWNGATVQLFLNGVPVYNGKVQQDLFSYTGKITSTMEGLLKISQDKQTVFLPLFIEPGTIKIRDEGKKLAAYGTSTNETFATLMKQFDSLALLQKGMRFNEVKQYKRSLATAFIKQSPSSPISLKLLADFFYLDRGADDTLYYQLYNNLDSTIKQSFTGKKLEQEVSVRYAVANGRQAPALELPDSSQQRFPIYQPGQFTLLNFWASWCLPCKREHPALQKLYKQYNEQGFTIVSISLDVNRSAWLNAVKTEQLDWLQLSDGKGFSSPAATTYGVKLIPYNILLDATGNIVGKNLRFEEIEAILSKIMGPLAF